MRIHSVKLRGRRGRGKGILSRKITNFSQNTILVTSSPLSSAILRLVRCIWNHIIQFMHGKFVISNIYSFTPQGYLICDVHTNHGQQ